MSNSVWEPQPLLDFKNQGLVRAVWQLITRSDSMYNVPAWFWSIDKFVDKDEVRVRVTKKYSLWLGQWWTYRINRNRPCINIRAKRDTFLFRLFEGKPKT